MNRGSTRDDHRRREIARQGALTAAYLSVIGGLALGVSGVLVAVLGRAQGSTFIVNLSPQTVLPAADCTRWLRNDPQAGSCYQAALRDWAAETVVNRLVVGVLALAGLFLLLRLRHRRPAWARLLPPLVVSTVGLIAFTALTLWLAGKGIAALALGAPGAGQWLGTAPPTLAAAAWFAARFAHEQRWSTPRPPGR
jgi:hypothetical protein